jgi:hypothetical protein
MLWELEKISSERTGACHGWPLPDLFFDGHHQQTPLPTSVKAAAAATASSASRFLVLSLARKKGSGLSLSVAHMIHSADRENVLPP